MKQHAALGHERLEPQPQVPAAIAEAVRHHHEYLDGSGYPDGLAGKEIDDLTRMLTVVDIYSALIEKRAYKKPRTPSEAMAILEGLAASEKVDKVLVTAPSLMVLT